DLAEQQVAGGVVAVLDRGRAQVAHGHAGGEVLLGLRRVRQDVPRRIVDDLVQRRAVTVVTQDGRGRERLESRAHREPLPRAIRHGPAGAHVPGVYAQPRAVAPFQIAQLVVRVGRFGAPGRRGGGDAGGRGGGGGGEGETGLEQAAARQR